MEFNDNRTFLEILPELRIIEYDTGLKINKAKDLKIIRDIHNRQLEELVNQVPGHLEIKKKNRLSLYFTMHCFHRVNNSN